MVVLSCEPKKKAATDTTKVAMDTSPLERLLRDSFERTVAAKPENPRQFFACAAAQLVGVRAIGNSSAKNQSLQCELPWESPVVGYADLPPAMGRAAAQSMATETGNMDNSNELASSYFAEVKTLIEEALLATLQFQPPDGAAPTPEQWPERLAVALLRCARCSVKAPPAGALQLPADGAVQCSLPWESHSVDAIR